MDTERHDEPLMEGLPSLPEGASDAEAPAGLREAVWRQTSARVRRRGHVRRAVVACGLIAAYAGGLATAYLLAGAVPEPAGRVAKDEPVPVAATPAPEPAPVAAAADNLPRDPEALAHLMSSQTREERAVVLERVGKRYLYEQGDVKLATRCYSRALALMPAIELDSDDDWLLANLKQARQQEIGDENAST